MIAPMATRRPCATRSSNGPTIGASRANGIMVLSRYSATRLRASPRGTEKNCDPARVTAIRASAAEERKDSSTIEASPDSCAPSLRTDRRSPRMPRARPRRTPMSYSVHRPGHTLSARCRHWGCGAVPHVVVSYLARRRRDGGAVRAAPGAAAYPARRLSTRSAPRRSSSPARPRSRKPATSPWSASTSVSKPRPSASSCTGSSACRLPMWGGSGRSR